MIISINTVLEPEIKSAWAIKKMVKVLEKQGQIEPLQVQECNGLYSCFSHDLNGQEILLAAKYLEWPTILVCVMEKYEY